MFKFFCDDEKPITSYYGRRETRGIIRWINDRASFTLLTNYIKTIQVQKFYVINIITIVQTQ